MRNIGHEDHTYCKTDEKLLRTNVVKNVPHETNASRQDNCLGILNELAKASLLEEDYLELKSENSGNRPPLTSIKNQPVQARIKVEKNELSSHVSPAFEQMDYKPGPLLSVPKLENETQQRIEKRKILSSNKSYCKVPKPIICLKKDLFKYSTLVTSVKQEQEECQSTDSHMKGADGTETSVMASKSEEEDSILKSENKILISKIKEEDSILKSKMKILISKSEEEDSILKSENKMLISKIKEDSILKSENKILINKIKEEDSILKSEMKILISKSEEEDSILKSKMKILISKSGKEPVLADPLVNVRDCSAQSDIAQSSSIEEPRPATPDSNKRSRSRSRSPLRVPIMDEPSSPPAPPYSPLSSPRGDSPRVVISRQSMPLDVVLGIYDESGAELQFVTGDEFVAPDAHALYVSEHMEMERESVSDRSERGEGARGVARGRARGGRRGRVSGRGRRGQGVGGGRRRRDAAGAAWQVGHPLEEIWVTDDDVPLQLREMAMDVVRRRQRSAEEQNASNRTTSGRRNAMDEDNDSESDVFEDANDGSTNSHFEWATMDSFHSSEEIFLPERTGSVVPHTTPYDAFISYWDESILQLIVEQTNRYALKISSPSFLAEWYPTNSHEILCLFAFWMMLGIVRMPTIESCFSTHFLLKTEVFRHILTLKRYRHLVRALHFIDSDPSYNAASASTSGTNASSDRICYLRPIINHLNAKFQANYILSRDICIDESLTLWKGRLNIKQYIRSKAAKFGIKTFELCESATGYLWSLLVYTGRHNDFEQPDPTVLKSTAVVKKLIAPLLNKGHRLFMDNWYNSPLLARFLKRNGTDCVGTLRASRQDVPLVIKKAPLRQGQFVARHAGDLCVLSWQDKKRVNMISTCHGSDMGLATITSRQPSRPLPFKPQMVLDYNRSMGGVDLKDQMLEPYLLERKRCAKWYLKLFKRFLNVSILNARILVQSSTQSHEDHLKFRLQLVDSIVAHHLPHCPKSRRASAAAISGHSHHLPLQHTHWPVIIPPSTYRAASNRKGRARCVVCISENRTQFSAYKCETCNVALCVENCFRKYHTTPHTS